MRIEPPYLIAMVASFALMRLVFPISGWSLGASLLDVHQAVYGFASPWNAPAWSLEVEVQWYLVVPLVAYALSSRAPGRRYLVATLLIVAALCVQSSAGLATTRTAASLVSWLQFFLAGWLAADVLQTSAIGRRFRPRVWDVVGALGWPALFVLVGRWSLQMTIAPLLIALLLVAALHGPTTGRILRQGWLIATGRISFSIYLVHFPIFLLVRWLIGPAPWSSFAAEFAFWGVVLIPVTLLISAAFHRLIERPFVEERWRSWLGGNRGRDGQQRTEDITRSETSTPASPIAPPAAVP
jgi:peptidoglycan/LPS O-acetylase OafA/YrhL